MESEIREIAGSIWETLFTLPLDPAPDAGPLGEPAVTGCVTIDGAWQGAVMLSCERQLADRLAGQLFRSGTPSVEEVRDAMGELTNMLAGNVKALLPGPSRISLPSVAVGGDYDLSVVGTVRRAVVHFRCDGSTLQVSVHESKDGAA